MTILTNDNYIRMNDFDNVGIDFYSHWELEYEQVMTKMTESKKLSIFQCLLFRALHLDKGWKLGAKKCIMLQMLLFCKSQWELIALSFGFIPFLIMRLSF